MALRDEPTDEPCDGSTREMMPGSELHHSAVMDTQATLWKTFCDPVRELFWNPWVGGALRE